MLMRPFLCLISISLMPSCTSATEQKAERDNKDNDRDLETASDTGPSRPEAVDTGDATVEPDSGMMDSPEDAIGDDASSAAELSAVSNWNWEVPLAYDAIDHESDVDVYRLEMVAGTILFLAVESVDVVDLELRLFDSEGRDQGRSEIMPHRAWGDDPGIWIHARYTGALFVEVSSPEPSSSAGNYRLRGAHIEAEDGEPNNTTADANARLDDGTAGFRASLVDPDEQTEFLGMIQSSGDVDLWAVQVPSTGVMTWSLWPLGTSSLNPEVILYDQDFNPVAWGNECAYAGSGLWYDDVGIMYPVIGGQRLYLSVSNLRPSSGPGSMYVGTQTLQDSPVVETEPNDDLSGADWVTMNSSTTHPEYSHFTGQGTLNLPDEKDVVAFRVEDVGGQYMSVHVQAGSLGSGLEASIALVGDPDGVTSLGTASADGSGDVRLTDVLIPEGSGPGVYLEVTAVSRDVESFGNQYFLGVESYAVPLYE